MYAHPGDRLIAEGDAARTGLIIGVPHHDGSPPYIVKWLSDGHIAMVWPGDFARIVPAQPPAPNGQPVSTALDCAVGTSAGNKALKSRQAGTSGPRHPELDALESITYGSSERGVILMSMLTRRDYRGPFGEMVDWLEAPWAVLRPMTGHPMRVEDFVRDGNYVIRAELPGIDPEKDVTVTVANGILTIKAERHEETISKHHSEFRYGNLSRSVTLPASADEDHIEATCSHGVLEVTVKLAEKATDSGGRKITVRQDQHIKPT